MTRAEATRLLDGIGLHQAVGLRLDKWSEDEVTFRLAPPLLCRERESGGVHGGAIMIALDTAACFAMIARTGVDCSTVDLRVDFLRPAVDAEFVVRGATVRAGKRLGCADALLHTLGGELMAVGRGSFSWRPSAHP